MTLLQVFQNFIVMDSNQNTYNRLHNPDQKTIKIDSLESNDEFLFDESAEIKPLGDGFFTVNDLFGEEYTFIAYCLVNWDTVDMNSK